MSSRRAKSVSETDARVHTRCVRLALVINYGLATALFTCILPSYPTASLLYTRIRVLIYTLPLHVQTTAVAKPLAAFSLLFKFAVARLWLGTLKGLGRVAKFSGIIKTLLVNALYDKQSIYFTKSYSLFTLCSKNGILQVHVFHSLLLSYAIIMQFRIFKILTEI